MTIIQVDWNIPSLGCPTLRLVPNLGIPSLGCPILRLGRFEVWAQHVPNYLGSHKETTGAVLSVLSITHI